MLLNSAPETLLQQHVADLRQLHFLEQTELLCLFLWPLVFDNYFNECKKAEKLKDSLL